MSRLLSCMLLLLVCAPSAYAQQHAPSTHVPSKNIANVMGKLNIPHITGNIKIDGELDDSQWKQAARFSLTYVTSPSENTPSPIDTQVQVYSDNDTLYVAFVAKDPNIDALRAFYRDRDKVWSHDLVGLKLDPYNDGRIAYQFFVNPFGIQADAIENEMTGRESDNWDAIWQSAAKVLDDGYQVEMAIPLRIMNFEESDNEKNWGAEFVRFYPREDRLRISNIPRDRNNSCILCQLGKIVGFKEAKQGKNLVLVPTLVLGKGKSRDLEETFDWQDSNTQEIGLDFKWGITPEISLQATLNPDFSQVESDVAQLSINNTFALYFDEKRPFFLENADYFTSYNTLVHTRNINAPDYGAKITGRIEQHTFGFFVANDQTTSFTVPGNLNSKIAQLEEESINLAARYRHDLSDNLSIGWTSTLRESDSYHNYVNGIDAKYQLTQQDTLQGQFISSATEYPDQLYKEFCDNDCATLSDYSETALRLKQDGDFSGTALRLGYIHKQRNWSTKVRYQAEEADFRADLGRMAKVDQDKLEIGGAYNWFSEDTWWNRIRLSGNWDITHNDANEIIEKEAEIYLGARAKLQSYFEFGLLTRERVGLRHDPSILSIKNNTQLFTETQPSFFFEIRPLPSLYLSTKISYGDQVDFTNDRLGKQLQVRPTIGLDLGEHLRLRLRHTYKELDIHHENLFNANLSDLRVTYQFNQKQFLRLIVVHSDIERNQALYINDDVDKEYKSLGTQLLYSYKISPLTKMFMGYSDSAIQDDLIHSLKQNERSVFMKFSYAWML